MNTVSALCRHVTCHRLPHRALVHVSGRDAHALLQGVITNDVTLLTEKEPSAIYTHLLSVQGRTLYDVILYRMKEVGVAGGLLLECDASVRDALVRHLSVYKIRRRVEVGACPELRVWALLPRPHAHLPEGASLLVPDPRTDLMGWRLIGDAHLDPCQVMGGCGRGSSEDYHRHRYTIGVPEGVADLPPGEALPLESNLVYLRGVSFSKGCYLGQELTARSHHTGVVRKRLMPVSLSCPAQRLRPGAALETMAGKPAGKYRGGIQNVGLGLVRLAHADQPLRCGHASLQASVPAWWPQER